MKEGMRDEYLELALTRQAERVKKWARKAERFREECPPGGHEIKAPIENPGAKKTGERKTRPVILKLTSKGERTK